MLINKLYFIFLKMIYSVRYVNMRKKNIMYYISRDTRDVVNTLQCKLYLYSREIFFFLKLMIDNHLR